MNGIKTFHKADIYCPNFDHYLQLKLENITEYQIANLEMSVQRKITRHRSDAINYLSLTEKMHILSVGFGDNVLIVVQNNEEGITPKVFSDTVKAAAGHLNNSVLLDKVISKGIFVQGDRQVMDALIYLNHIETSDIYNLFKLNHPKRKGSREKKFDEKMQILSEVVDYMLQYESVKRRVLDLYRLNVPKLYGLLFFYKKERLCKDFYDRKFKYAYCKTRSELSRALAEMYRAGLLNKRGTTRELKYSITSKGIDLLIKVLNKLLYDV
jgi:hypothetical protein